MSRITRRWCLLALAGAPVGLAVEAKPFVVRLDGDTLRVSAPDLKFLAGKPLDRLHDGQTVVYLGQLSVSSGSESSIAARSVVRFAFSYDLWSGRFTVGVIPVTKDRPATKNLTPEAAQAWCLDRLKVDLSNLPPDRPIWVRLEIRSESPEETAGIVGESGISISGLVELFSHHAKDEQMHLNFERGPLTISDLRRGAL